MENNNMEELFEQDFRETEKISVKDLDDALIACRDSEEEYEEVHKLSSAAWNKFQINKNRLIEMMVSANKTRWQCSGVKGFSLKESLKYKLPKELDKKKLFFDFLGGQKASELLQQNPEEIFLSYATVHAGSLNTLCRKLVEEAADKGESLDLAGIDAPVTERTLISLRK